jgi:hypothetical protein
MGFNAMALAPTISDIPDIIVGDAEDGSGSNVFVYPDAIDLDNRVSDDDALTSEIRWSFQTTGASRYLINGLGPESTDAGDPLTTFVDPTNDIRAADDDVRAEDSDAQTITIRDNIQSPLASEPDTSGYSSAVASQVVTLYASDGTTVSNPAEASGEEGIIIIYTQPGEDSWSPPDVGVPVVTIDFTAGTPTGWEAATGSFDGGGSTSSSDAEGLCLEASPAATDANASWISPYGEWDLVKNCVYKLRLGVEATNTTVGNQPLWRIVYDNFDSAGEGKNSYGGEIWLLDNEGGANSAVSPTGRAASDGEEFIYWMMPPCFQAPYFQDETNGMFSPANDPGNDFRIYLELFDVAAAGIGAETDVGKICFKDMVVQRYDYSLVREVGAADMDDDTLTNTGDEWGNDITAGFNTSVTYSGGAVTFASSGSTWTDIAQGLMLFRPGDTTAWPADSDPATLVDNYPISHDENSTYLVEFEIEAPTQTDALNGPDIIRFGASLATGEVVTDHNLATNVPDTSDVALRDRGLVMPRSGGPYKYAILFNTLSYSNSAIDAQYARRMQPRFEILCGNVANPLGRTTNTGSLRISRVKVQKVEF